MLSKNVLLFCGLLATVALAHPHVFADVKVKVLFDEKGFSGIQNHWVYDEIYSAATIATVDRNGDGQLNAQESELLKESVFSELAKSNYFNYVQSGSVFLNAKPVQTFRATVENGRLVFDFLVSFSVPVQSDYSLLVIVVADPSNYVQITADMENAKVSAPGNIDVEFFADGLEGLSLFRAFLPWVEGLYLRFKKK